MRQIFILMTFLLTSITSNSSEYYFYDNAHSLGEDLLFRQSIELDNFEQQCTREPRQQGENADKQQEDWNNRRDKILERQEQEISQLEQQILWSSKTPRNQNKQST